MRGFYNKRLDIINAVERSYKDSDAPVIAGVSRRIWDGPHTDPELAAAKKQGCAGCRWWTQAGVSGVCHNAEAPPQRDPDPDRNGTSHATFWCSEWSGEPTPVDEQP